MFLDDTACNLASMNLLTFLNGRIISMPKDTCPRHASLDADA